MYRFLRLRIYNAEETAVEYDNSIDDDWGIVAGTARLDRSIMQTELKFGELIANMLQIQVYGLPKNVNLKSRKVILSCEYEYEVRDRLINDSGDFVVNSDGDYIATVASVETAEEALFTGYIDTSDTDIIKTDRLIVAYDNAFSIRDIDVSTWWNSYWTTHAEDTITLATFRTALLSEFNIPYVSTTLLNDSLVITNNLSSPSKLTLGTVLTMICQLQVCCPNINGSGDLEFITLATTPYSIGDLEGLNSTWSDYVTEKITGIGIYDTSQNIAQLVGTDTNVYNISGNIFLLGMTATQITNIGTTILNAIKDIQYTPCSMQGVISQFNHKLGDYVYTPNGYAYILMQSFSGALLVNEQIDSPAFGPQLSARVDTINDEFVNAQKFAKIEKDIDEFSIDYADFKENTESQFEQTAEDITLAVKGVVSRSTIIVECYRVDTSSTTATLECRGNADFFSTSLNTVFGIRMTSAFSSTALPLNKELTVNLTTPAGPLGLSGDMYYDDTTRLTNQVEVQPNDILYVRITGTASNITFTVLTEALSHSEITVMKDEIVLKVDSAGKIVAVKLSADPTGSALQIGADNINLSANDVFNIMSGGTLNLTGKSIQISSTNFSVTSAGAITAKSGTIGGFNIDTSKLYNGMTSLTDTTHNGVYVGTDGIGLGAGKFKVTKQGAITATSGEIGGWTISTDRLATLDSTTGNYVALFDGTNSDNYAIYIRTGTSQANYEWPFIVKTDGSVTMRKLTATGGTIGGWTINSTYLSYGNAVLTNTYLRVATTNYYTTFSHDLIYQTNLATLSAKRVLNYTNPEDSTSYVGEAFAKKMNWTDGVYKDTTSNTSGQVMHARAAGHSYQCNWTGSQLDFYVDTTNVGTISDKRLKKDIENVNIKLIEAIKECEMKQYKADNRGGLISFGIIAQDLVKACEDRDIDILDYEILQKRHYKDGDDTDYYMIDSGQLAILEIQALKEEIKELRRQINE